MRREHTVCVRPCVVWNELMAVLVKGSTLILAAKVS
jgi:hypothetical protein